ncbi:ChuX/HutX family heme-like substrate-binding protein [Parvibaculum sp.]|uniref:hemin-degrading factor n=1 Tax=Parvibaculum sp. TaxID=2024848 RepID=UPI001B0CB448|nr:ChuX/HutX family heme-like substrate-binding protein [Parvibaculum sp.]MBO6666496.1 hemin-degrading factor [Parvibaculum sp.]MBO6690909.1 hemin-degrading factor [Parvibaculum sp.]MBO6713117.1 hemin-degrading factor [Parvibaculum sp.]
MSVDSTIASLVERRAAILAAEPNLRARNLAERLGISEAELVALGGEKSEVTRLRPEWSGIIGAVGALGRVMALTRNESVVHERKGVYGTLEGGAHVGLIVGEDIDLRIFFTQWKFGFAVVEKMEDGSLRRSLQFFDAHGTAIHKIYQTPETDTAAFDALIARFATEASPVEVTAAPAPKQALPDSEIDVAGFRAAWDALKDTHEFHGLINKFKVQRLQGVRLAGEGRAARVPAASLRATLEAAKSGEVPIMVFVGNPGMIQIHTGPVENLKPMGPWFNVLDEKFNLHLREDHIDSAWVVWKPTEDGTVTSLELFDREGTLIATLFGKRKPGVPEDEAWRAIVNGLPEREAA